MYITTYYVYAPHSRTPIVATSDYKYVQHVVQTIKGSRYEVTTTKVEYK